MATMDEIVAQVPEHERDHVRALAEDALFMRAKLAETRRGIAKQQVVIPYDNGGGQMGIRLNPAFTGYESLLKSYSATMRDLTALVDKYAEKAEAAHPDTPLMRILADAESVAC